MRGGLLGALPEAGRVSLERDLTGNSILLKKLEAVESRLINAFVEERLPETERAVLENLWFPAGQLNEAATAKFSRTLIKHVRRKK